MIFASYLNPADEYVDYVPNQDVVAGTPIEIAPGWWGVAPVPIPSGTRGALRVYGNFRGLKVNPADSFAVGDLLDFTPGSGFALGDTWRVVDASATGQTHVVVEINAATASGGGGGAAPIEVVRQSGDLSGVAPAESKLGINYATGRLYYKNGSGNWAIVTEDWDHLQLTPSDTWTINHGKGRYPDDVTVFNAAGNEVFAHVSNPTVNQTVITFELPATGRANLEFQ